MVAEILSGIRSSSKETYVKFQDAGFFTILAILLVIRKPIWFVYAGLLCFVLAIPLFASWTFFTAERLTWYGAAFVFVFLLISLLRPNTVK